MISSTAGDTYRYMIWRAQAGRRAAELATQTPKTGVVWIPGPLPGNVSHEEMQKAIRAMLNIVERDPS